MQNYKNIILFKGTKRYKYWAIENFTCGDFGCTDTVCTYGFKKDEQKQIDELWFTKKKIGEGAFGKAGFKLATRDCHALPGAY